MEQAWMYVQYSPNPVGHGSMKNFLLAGSVSQASALALTLGAQGLSVPRQQVDAGGACHGGALGTGPVCAMHLLLPSLNIQSSLPCPENGMG